MQHHAEMNKTIVFIQASSVRFLPWSQYYVLSPHYITNPVNF